MKANSRIFHKGFSLIETVIVIALFFTLIVGLSFLFIRHNQIYHFEDALIHVTGTARQTMQDINTFTLQAHRVLNSQTVNGTAYTSGAATLVLQLPSINSSSAIIANTWDYVAFYKTGSQVWEQYQAGTGSIRPTITKLLTDSAASLTFTYDNATFASVKKVTVDLQTSQVYKTQTTLDHLEQQIRLRNY